MLTNFRDRHVQLYATLPFVLRRRFSKCLFKECQVSHSPVGYLATAVSVPQVELPAIQRCMSSAEPSANKNDQAHCIQVDTDATSSQPQKPCKDLHSIFCLFSQLAFGLRSVDRKSWSQVFVQSTAYEISDLIPGWDYGVSIQSVLGSDTSQTVSRAFSTRKSDTHAVQCTATLTETRNTALQTNKQANKLLTLFFQAQLEYAASVWTM